eukprot:791978_1
MGNCLSERDPQDVQVNAELQRDKKRYMKVKKLLFLGSGGSGKTTIFKQLRGIYGTGFTEQDRQLFVSHIHSQVICQMRYALDILIEYKNGSGYLYDIFRQNEKQYFRGRTQSEIEDNASSEEMKIPKLSEEAEEAKTVINELRTYRLTDEIVAALKCLWAEQAIQIMYKMRNITKIDDSSAYFWSKLDELNTTHYMPDEADILLVRHRTTGTSEQRFELPNGEGTFLITDVGGQISERRKWIRCFDSVTAVIFVASLSSYNEVLFEDYSVNSMVDQMQLFENICNEDAFDETTFILFLNKKDIFIDKIKTVAITQCPSFAEFQGDPHSFDETT